MKKSIKPLVLSIIFLASLAFAQITLAQAPPPPPPSGSKGGAANHAPGGGAPIEGGLVISLAMIAGFGGWKLLKFVQNRKKVTAG